MNNVKVTNDQYSYTNIASATAIAVKTGAGFFNKIVINNAGTAWEVDVYDGTGTTGARIGTLRNASVPQYILYEIPITTGIYIDAVKGTTSGDLIVVYK